MGLVDMPFDVKNVSIENGEAEAHTKIGWLRSVSNVPHGFADPILRRANSRRRRARIRRRSCSI